MENNEDKVETGHRGEVILQQPQHSASFEFFNCIASHITLPYKKVVPLVTLVALTLEIFGRTGE